MGLLIVLHSKPQLIDAALLRPGRFDRLVFCDFPRWDERLEILKVHSRTVSLLSGKWLLLLLWRFPVLTVMIERFHVIISNFTKISRHYVLPLLSCIFRTALPFVLPAFQPLLIGVSFVILFNFVNDFKLRRLIHLCILWIRMNSRDYESVIVIVINVVNGCFFSNVFRFRWQVMPVSKMLLL